MMIFKEFRSFKDAETNRVTKKREMLALAAHIASLDGVVRAYWRPEYFVIQGWSPTGRRHTERIIDNYDVCSPSELCVHAYDISESTGKLIDAGVSHYKSMFGTFKVVLVEVPKPQNGFFKRLLRGM